MRSTLYLLFLLLILAESVQAQPIAIVESKCAVPGEKIVAKGTFKNLSSITIKCIKRDGTDWNEFKNVNYGINEDKDEIIFSMPNFAYVDIDSCSVRFRFDKEAKVLAQSTIGSCECDIVSEIIKLNNMKPPLSRNMIIEHIAYLKNQKSCYGSTVFTTTDMERLRRANFTDEEISKISGVPQSINLGLAAIVVEGSKEVTPAPMIRIFLTPKSFLDERQPFTTVKGFFERIDVNLGYAPLSIRTDKERSQHILVGFSYEMNKYALFNAGVAFSVTEEQRQLHPYFGITIDSNLLRDIGVLSKTKSLGFAGSF